jgi:hypothetical protein
MGGNPVVGVCQCPFQRYHLPYFVFIGVGGCPDFSVEKFYARLYFGNFGAGFIAFFLHCHRVNKRFESRAYLTGGIFHLVVFEIAVVGTAHVCFHMTGVRFHRHQAGAQKPIVIFYGIHRRHGGVYGVVPRKDTHSHGCIKHRINLLLCISFRLQVAIAVGISFGAFIQFVSFGVCEVGKGRIFYIFPMIKKRRLQLAAQPFSDGFFGVSLHSGINGGVYFQSVFIEVVRGSVGFFMVFTPSSQLQPQVFPKVGRQAGVLVLYGI